MIRIEDLSYRYPDSMQYALRDVNLEVQPGEFLVITGPSGCGKSTLALAIGGYLFRQFDGQSTGSVTVAGMDVRESPIYDIAEVVGLVQQNPEAQFCTLTVADEVAFGLENRCLPRAEIRERMTWALRIVGADYLVDRHLATLSGGEKQKVAIAAMIAARPSVLIFDEPTSSLDPTATADIFQVIERIRAESNITVIVIEHKVDYLQRFRPRLIEMESRLLAVADRQHPAGSTKRRVLPAFGSRDGPLVRVVDLRAGYNGRPVLDGLSLELHAGEFVSLMGDNGSGKTTFLYCLLGLHRPSDGHVEVMRQDTRHSSVSELARHVGFVFQNPDHQLFADSVWQEATFAASNFGLLDDANEGRVRELLNRCGLGSRLDEHPYRLSYGQKRRLNLISVLAYRPQLILVDELLIGQDPVNAAFLLDLLREHVEQGGAVVMANHAPRITGHYASRVLFFSADRPVVDATPLQAFAQLLSMGKDAYVA